MSHRPYPDYAQERKARILKSLASLSKIKEEEDFFFLLEKLPNDEAATKAFENFCLKMKLLLSDHIATRNAENAQRKRDREAYNLQIEKERRELLTFCKNINRKTKYDQFSISDQQQIDAGRNTGYLHRTLFGYFRPTERCLEQEARIKGLDY